MVKITGGVGTMDPENEEEKELYSFGSLPDLKLESRERIRQIEMKAIQKLKHPNRRQELRKLRELVSHG